MEFYGRNPERSGLQPGQPAEWGPAGAETGLEESMLRLGLGSSEFYPERPGVPDCVYYMRTGFCGFGSRCRYNHPRDRAAVAAAVMATGDYPERPGEPPCQYYLKTGTCKFGASCKFHHPRHVVGSLSNVPLNISGYPLRPGEKECSYYLKTGQCKFGVTCKFHHPQPAVTSLPASAPQFYPPVQSPSVHIPEQYGGVSSNLARPPLLHTSYVPPGGYGPVLYPSGVVPVPGWNPYSAPVSPIPSPGAHSAVGATSLYGVANMPSSTSTIGGSYSSLPSHPGPSSSGQREQVFPERPGEPECKYYMKTGDCKFGSSCRYHHPRDRGGVLNTNCALNPLGLPLRPGVQPCAFYLQNGHCKFGAACKFDHPMGGTARFSSSASSFIDVPVATYPVGSLLATLAPSPSTQELRPSSVDASSNSVGLVFSQPGSISISAPLGSSRGTRQGAEVHHSS